MSGLGFLDLVIGLIFIYFVLSIVVSVIQEIRANIFRLRAKNLEKWFNDTLAGNVDNLGKLVYKHRLLDGLVRKKRNPSYIPNEHFVTALLDVIHRKDDDTQPYDIDTLKESVKNSNLLPQDLKRFILQSIAQASGELKNVRADIAAWYDDAMSRVSGTYKNIHQWFVILVSFVVVAAFNADTISLSKYLYENDQARMELAEKAAEAINEEEFKMFIAEQAKDHSDTTEEGEETSESVDETLKKIQVGIDSIKVLNKKIKEYNLPLGWTKGKKLPTDKPTGTAGWILKIIGLSITAFAVSLGSNFWFDLLNKLVNLRGAGGKPQTVVDTQKQANKKDTPDK